MKSLVFFPSERTAPKEVIAHLREIDPTFDLVWIQTAWVLGRVRPNTIRYLGGGRILVAELGLPDPDPGVVGYARLVMQGFAATESYDHNQADSRIVEDARMRIFNLQTRAKQIYADRLDETLGGPKLRANQARARDGVLNLGKDAWRRGFKRPTYNRPTRIARHSS